MFFELAEEKFHNCQFKPIDEILRGPFKEAALRELDNEDTDSSEERRIINETFPLNPKEKRTFKAPPPPRIRKQLNFIGDEDFHN